MRDGHTRVVGSEDKARVFRHPEASEVDHCVVVRHHEDIGPGDRSCAVEQRLHGAAVDSRRAVAYASAVVCKEEAFDVRVVAAAVAVVVRVSSADPFVDGPSPLTLGTGAWPSDRQERVVPKTIDVPAPPVRSYAA